MASGALRRYSKPAQDAASAAEAPTTAPITPSRLPRGLKTVYPQSAPMMARPASEPGLVRSGMNGSLSAIISPTASAVMTGAAFGDPNQASTVPSTFKSLARAAVAIIAGPVIERSPLTAPIVAAQA